MHYFARATYSNNIGYGTEAQDPYGLFASQNNVPAIVGGADFTTGNFTHSIRYGYLKFINNLNGTSPGVYDPGTTLGFQAELGVRNGSNRLYAGGNEDAPQKTYQTSKQFRYDGTWTKGAHNLKFGGEITRILGGGFAAFYNDMVFESATDNNTQFALGTCAVPTGRPSAAIPAAVSAWTIPFTATSLTSSSSATATARSPSGRPSVFPRRPIQLASCGLRWRFLEGQAIPDGCCRPALEHRYRPRQSGSGNAYLRPG